MPGVEDFKIDVHNGGDILVPPVPTKNDVMTLSHIDDARVGHLSVIIKRLHRVEFV